MYSMVYAVPQIFLSIFASDSCVTGDETIVTSQVAGVGLYDFAIIVEMKVRHAFELCVYV